MHPGDAIRDNLNRIRDRIRHICSAQGRDPGTITLVVVTKQVGPEMMNLLSPCGVTDIGENRVQAALAKAPAVSSPYRWHFIGHLQTNKVKKALEFFTVLHSLDRMDLARECQKVLAQRGETLEAFVQVNVSGEKSKQGMVPDRVPEFFAQIRDECPYIHVTGLMTMAPLHPSVQGSPVPYGTGAPQTAKSEETRKYFRQLRELSERVGVKHLSMGMSQDYTIALEEGADTLRIGSAVFEGTNA